ncbi:unnamed protein product [Dicrocoelium dendriticum]|nr:unnamed protein product [Dicrocoelium dendriticum]
MHTLHAVADELRMREQDRNMLRSVLVQSSTSRDALMARLSGIFTYRTTESVRKRLQYLGWNYADHRTSSRPSTSTSLLPRTILTPASERYTPRLTPSPTLSPSCGGSPTTTLTTQTTVSSPTPSDIAADLDHSPILTQPSRDSSNRIDSSHHISTQTALAMTPKTLPTRLETGRLPPPINPASTAELPASLSPNESPEVSSSAPLTPAPATSQDSTAIFRNLLSAAKELATKCPSPEKSEHASLRELHAVFTFPLDINTFEFQWNNAARDLQHGGNIVQRHRNSVVMYAAEINGRACVPTYRT